MTTMLALSLAGLSWLGAGVALWGIFVALGLRFEIRGEAPGVAQPPDVSHRPLSSAAEIART